MKSMSVSFARAGAEQLAVAVRRQAELEVVTRDTLDGFDRLHQTGCQSGSTGNRSDKKLAAIGKSRHGNPLLIQKSNWHIIADLP